MAAGLRSLRPVACVAALNAAAQGLVGVVLGILALCVCFCALGKAPQASSNNDLAQYLTAYLQGDACSSTGPGLYSGLTGVTALRIWMALSLFFSVSMMVSSFALLTALAKHWTDEKLQIALVSWIFINIFTAIDDLILGYIYSTDYSKSLDQLDAGTVGPVAVGLVAFLAFRGVYLWLFNLLLIMYLIRGARALHKHINHQMPRRQGSMNGVWPSLDDFGKTKPDIDRTSTFNVSTIPTAINPRLSERLDNGDAAKFPDHTAMARWPNLNGQPHTMRERSMAAGDDVSERRSKTLRESSFRRQGGVDNPGYETDRPYYLRLQSESGSTLDFEDRERESQEWELPRERDREYELPKNQGRDWELPKNQGRDWEIPKPRDRDSHPRDLVNQDSGSDQWDLPKNQWELPKSADRAKQEASKDYGASGPKPKSYDAWREKQIPPPPPTGYTEENGIPIPPVDYLDQQQPEPNADYEDFQRPLSLQEAILDRTLRLKKVPEKLRKGLQ